jgi:arabinose-5-phosphate isomerase
MLTGEALPVVSPEASMAEALPEMNAKHLGCVLVMDKRRRLLGIITDGDLRRAMVKYGDIRRHRVSEVMTPKPKTIREDQLAADALESMERNLITVLPVVDETGKVKGILHLHDILGKGQFKFTGV